jgi:hypothetical protein
MASALAGGGVDAQKAAEAKSLFDAARQYYGGANALVDKQKTDATPGLAREAGDARQGHAVALRGALHASLVTLLTGAGDNSASNSKVVLWLKRDLRQVCAPAS